MQLTVRCALTRVLRFYNDKGLIRTLKTYGPFTRCYDHPIWAELPLAERARLMTRQGQSFATAQELRVVYPPKDADDQALVDVPKDGKTLGEVVIRGNIVMKEVRPYDSYIYSRKSHEGCCCSTLMTQRRPVKHLGVVTSILEILL